MGCGASTTCIQHDERKLSTQENKDFSQTMDFLNQIPLFKRLPKDQHPLLATACAGTVFKTGQVIIKQGDTGNEFFIIRSGEAEVFVNDAKVATLKSGDYFGENALKSGIAFRDEPRTATIKAVSEIEAIIITREKFQEAGLNGQLQFANRKAVGAGGGVGRQLQTKPPSPKTDEERKLMEDSLKSNVNLQNMVSLDAAQITQMIDVAWREEVAAGKEIITEGDLDADYFYIVQEGSFEIFISQADPGEDGANKRDESKFVSMVTKGGNFGELALLYLVPRAATVMAKENGQVWVIDRQNFKNILMKVTDEKIAEYVKYLDRVDLLAPLISEEKKALAEALVEMHFTKGEVILQQGEPGNTFYIMYDGEVAIIKDGTEDAKLMASPTRGTAQFFGEKALLSGETRGATVQVASNTAKALALDRDSFNMILGPLEEIIKRQSQENATSRPNYLKGKGGTIATPTEQKREKILIKDLQKLGLLGCGGFGAVELFEHKKSQETYAMKGLSKGYVVKTGMQETVMNEKNILMMTNSAFIIKLFECYNSSQMLYFLMEPALGGELFATYNRKGFHGSGEHAKFYCAGVVLAFEHMHERRIIYRDLKPENLLLNELGQIKLTDMGLAKFVIGKTYTTCGTPDYFAPEMIASTGHTKAVDWWTLGILTFELMTGHPPFESAYPMQTYSKVMQGISKIQFRPACQGPVGELIKVLLKKEPSERLPMQVNGAKKLREARWYAGFDWKSMSELSLEVPYKPVVKSKKDIENFSAREEDMPPKIKYEDDGSGWDKDFAT